MKRERWESYAWGIEMQSQSVHPADRGRWMLLGWGWVDHMWKEPPFLTGQTRILAYGTRAEARAVARDMKARANRHGSRWYFRPVSILTSAERTR